MSIKTEHITGLPTTRRAQRLKKKPESDFMAKATEAFGGGMMGMSSDVWHCIQQVCDLDYMSAAEYELGVFPDCIQDMVKRQYRVLSFVIEAKDVKPGLWRRTAVDSLRGKEIREAKARGEKPPRMTKKHRAELEEQAKANPVRDRTIWTWLCDEIHPRAVAEHLIRRVASGEVRPKSGARFDLDTDPRYETTVFGWVDLDNQLCWFTDEDMAKSWNALFVKESS